MSPASHQDEAGSNSRPNPASRPKITPCLWYDGDGEEAAQFYVSLLPGSRIEHVQKNVTDTPAGPKGSVLVVEFTLAGQRFVALNGGRKAEYSHAVSFQIDCADQAEVDRLWDAILKNGGREEACGWIRDRWDVPWQIVPRGLLDMISDPDPAKASRAMQSMMEMVKLDIATIRRAFDGA